MFVFVAVTYTQHVYSNVYDELYLFHAQFLSLTPSVFFSVVQGVRDTVSHTYTDVQMHTENNDNKEKMFPGSVCI